MKRAYKLQEFVAHSSNVNCLKIGKKSSRVLVTGGEDHKVNMWAIGKPNAILSLAGHTSAVESVTFDSSEVVVVAGSASGTIKLWDLEEAKIVRTLTGHRSNCISVDFHPFGEFFASGSLDTNLKIWDIRRKGCIHTYKGHTRGINAIKFSPDGRWVVSGGEDNVVKLWDLTAGKLMHDFKYHEGQVQCLDFHPHEFLLATGSADRTVKFFDLETFELIGSAGPEPAGVRAMVFNTDGRTILTAMQDSLKIFSWEPLRCHDMVDIGWHKLADLCIHEGKLLGCSFNQSCVGIWVVDLQRVAPYHSGNQVWKDDLSVGNQISNNGNQAPQEATPTSHTKSDSTTSLPHMMDMAMRNVKITSPKAAESSNSQPTRSTFNIGRRPASVQAMAPSSATPTFPSRRSSITTPKLVASSGFGLSSRADAHTGCSPRPSTAPECCQGLDGTRPTSTTGVVSMSTSKSYDRGLDNVRGDGNDDGHGDTSRIDPIPHASRSSSVKDSVRGSNSSVRGSDSSVRGSDSSVRGSNSSVRGSDSNVRGQTFQHASKPSLHSHLGTKEDNATLNWNGARSYSSRRSSTCDVPVDNSLGRSHSFSDESSRAQPTRNATGTEASTTGRLEVGCTTALPGQWERKEKLSLQETPALVEKPAVLERSSHQPRSFVVEKSGSLNVPSGGGGGVRTLGLDISSFVPKGSNFQSERTISAAKHDTDIIKELLLQHHMMSSIMQSRMTNMQVVRRYWNKNDMKGAIEAMKKMTDHSVLVEVLSAFMEKTNLLTLEICYLLIPLLNGLLSTDNDRFLMTALELLEKLVETFGPIIYETRTSSSSIGVDLQAEQRLDRCNMCYHELQAVGHSLLPLLRIGGDVTNAARNLQEALGRI